MSRVKHLFAVVLAALMLCLLMPVAAFAEEASDGKMIVYAKLPSDWSDPHLWAWADDGTNAFDAWPGGEMEADSNNDGWYYCWIPETTNNIIINANDAAGAGLDDFGNFFISKDAVAEIGLVVHLERIAVTFQSESFVGGVVAGRFVSQHS